MIAKYKDRLTKLERDIKDILKQEEEEKQVNRSLVVCQKTVYPPVIPDFSFSFCG